MAAGVGKWRKSSGVTMLTRASVHCAERMVATSSSQALRCTARSCAGVGFLEAGDDLRDPLGRGLEARLLLLRRPRLTVVLGCCGHYVISRGGRAWLPGVMRMQVKMGVSLSV